jgi:hypothetical protein
MNGTRRPLARFAAALLLAAGDAWAAPKQPAPPRNVETLCALPNLWAMNQDEFQQVAHKLGFVWSDVQRGQALTGGEGLQFAGLKSHDSRATFEGGKLAHLVIMLYSHAESGAINQFQFDEQLDRTKKALAAWAGQPPLPLPDLSGPARTKIQHCAWTNATTRTELEWSAMKPQVLEGRKLEFRADFIRLRQTPVTAAPAAAGAATKPRTAAELKARIKREANGDVLLEVPMVMNSAKGTVLAANTERVLRYYGLNFDQFQVSQVCDSMAAASGNSFNGLRDSLKKIAQKLGLRLVVVQDIEQRDFQRLVQDYNHAATAARVSKVTADMNNLDICRLYWNMDMDLLRTAKAKRTVDFNRFKTETSKSIEAGVPLIWHCMMGKVPEPGMSVSGSCVFLPRLLIGYNTKTGELLLSDGLGAGHELKRMKWEDAWAISLSLFIIKPNNLP